MLKFLRTLGRGAHVPHHKGTAGLPAATMPLPARIYLPMQQHIGRPCKPVVAKGDTVAVGTLVGEAQGPVSANIHSGVSGTVLGMEQLVAAGGGFVDAMVIEADGQQTIDPSVVPPTVRDRQSFLDAVQACGLVGLGGAGFPTAVKLNPRDPGALDVLIINAAECEPYITVDDLEMLDNGDTVISGIMAVKNYLNIPKVYIAIERNKPGAMDLMFALTKGDPELEVYPLSTVYPQGAEKVLIETVTGREVPLGGLPADVGVLVMNVTTVSFIGKYMASGLPLITRRVTVDGGAVVEPKNVEVIIGTPVADVLEFCGGFQAEPAKVLMGGPMMGVAMADLGMPVTKTTNAIMALTAREAEIPPPQPCIRCGNCIMACPVRISPVEIAEAYEDGDLERMGKLSADVCMNCGVCSYVCPTKRLLAPSANLARQAYIKYCREVAANAGK